MLDFAIVPNTYDTPARSGRPRKKSHFQLFNDGDRAVPTMMRASAGWISTCYLNPATGTQTCYGLPIRLKYADCDDRLKSGGRIDDKKILRELKLMGPLGEGILSYLIGITRDLPGYYNEQGGCDVNLIIAVSPFYLGAKTSMMQELAKRLQDYLILGLNGRGFGADPYFTGFDKLVPNFFNPRCALLFDRKLMLEIDRDRPHVITSLLKLANHDFEVRRGLSKKASEKYLWPDDRCEAKMAKLYVAIEAGEEFWTAKEIKKVTDLGINTIYKILKWPPPWLIVEKLKEPGLYQLDVDPTHESTKRVKSLLCPPPKVEKGSVLEAAIHCKSAGIFMWDAISRLGEAGEMFLPQIRRIYESRPELFGTREGGYIPAIIGFHSKSEKTCLNKEKDSHQQPSAASAPLDLPDLPLVPIDDCDLPDFSRSETRPDVTIDRERIEDDAWALAFCYPYPSVNSGGPGGKIPPIENFDEPPEFEPYFDPHNDDPLRPEFGIEPLDLPDFETTISGAELMRPEFDDLGPAEPPPPPPPPTPHSPSGGLDGILAFAQAIVDRAKARPHSQSPAPEGIGGKNPPRPPELTHEEPMVTPKPRKPLRQQRAEELFQKDRVEAFDIAVTRLLNGAKSNAPKVRKELLATLIEVETICARNGDTRNYAKRIGRLVKNKRLKRAVEQYSLITSKRERWQVLAALQRSKRPNS